MADRTVKVRLELDDDAFKGGLKGDAAAVREFDGEVRTLGDHAARTGVEMKAAGNEIQAAGEEIKAVGRAAVPTTDQVKKLGLEAKTTGEQVVSAGSRLETLTAALRNVDEEIARSKTLLGELAQEFGRTGDSSIVNKFSGTNSALSGLTKFRTELEKLKAEAERAPSGIGANAQGGLLNFAIDEWVSKVAQATKRGIADGANSLSGMAPTGIVQWLVAGAVVASPLIGAAIAAGVLLGVGGVGIAGGLALAAQDPRVRAAYSDLGAFAKLQLTDAASGFVAPAIQSAGQLKAALATIGPALKSDFDAVAPSVNNLVDGITGFVEKMQSHGLGDAFQAAKPVIDALAAELPNMGQAMGDFFHDIAAGGPGAVQAIHDIATAVDVTVENLGLVIEALSKAYDFIRNNPLGQLLSPLSTLLNLADGGDKATHSFQMLGQAGGGASSSIDGVGSSAQVTAQSLEQAAQASTNLLRTWASAEQATIGLDQAMLAMTGSVKQNGTALDETSAKGLANRSALLQAAQAAETKREADIKAGEGAETANAQYATNIGTLRAAAVAAGFNADQVDTMLHALRQVPGDYAARVDVNGVDTAVNQILSVKSALNSFGDKVIHVTTYQNTVTGQVGNTVRSVGFNRLGGVYEYEHAADGLLREARTFSAASTGARYAFAEPQTQGEAFIPKSGDLQRSRAIWGYVGANWLGMKGGAGQASVTNISLVVNAGLGANGREIGQQIIDEIRPVVNRNGGNVQMAVVGRQVP